MRKVMIVVAPVSYGQSGFFPTAAELIDDICECHDAGASVVHFHVTDQHGKPSLDRSFFEQVVDRVRSRCDIIIEGSTGGVGVSAEIRSIALEVPGLEMGSLNMGSCNLFGKVYENPPHEIERIASLMMEKGVVPDMCFFEPGFVESLATLRDLRLVTPPFAASVCLGFPGALPATVENLVFMVRKLPTDSVWTLVHHHACDFTLLAAAIAGGGHIRVGFEDSRHVAPQQMVDCNRQLVDQARELILQLGCELARPAEMRRQFGISAAKERVLQSRGRSQFESETASFKRP